MVSVQVVVEGLQSSMVYNLEDYYRLGTTVAGAEDLPSWLVWDPQIHSHVSRGVSTELGCRSILQLYP